MLSEDIQALGRFKKKAEYLLEFLAEEGQVEAAKFMFVVQGLLDHRVRLSWSWLVDTRVQGMFFQV